MNTKIAMVVIGSLFSASSFANSAGPDCSDINRSPTQMSEFFLPDLGFTDVQIDNKKTKTTLISSTQLTQEQAKELVKHEVDNAKRQGVLKSAQQYNERFLSSPIYKQVYRIRFTQKNGNVIDLITTTIASKEECSIAGDSISLISKEIAKN